MAGAWKLNTFVHVVERDSAGELTGRAGTYGPDDDVPGWVATATSNPKVWVSEGERSKLPAPPAAKPQTGAQASTQGGDLSAELAKLRAEVAELRASKQVSTEPGKPNTSPPPKGGAGSGAPEWRAYAARKGVEVPADANREQVIDALTAAGVPTE